MGTWMCSSLFFSIVPYTILWACIFLRCEEKMSHSQIWHSLLHLKLINFYEDVCNPWHFFQAWQGWQLLKALIIRIVGLFSHIHCIKFHKLAHQVAGRKKKKSSWSERLAFLQQMSCKQNRAIEQEPFSLWFLWSETKNVSSNPHFPQFLQFPGTVCSFVFSPPKRYLKAQVEKFKVFRKCQDYQRVARFITISGEHNCCVVTWYAGRTLCTGWHTWISC